jgi:AI-2 transport protein TqsA
MGLPKPHQQMLDSHIDGGADSTRPTSKIVVGLLSVMAVILSAGALKASAVVTMPLAFAFFVAILVHPIERSLAAHLPDSLQWLGVACAMLAVVGALALAVALLSFTIAPVLERAPQYADDLHRQWESLRTWASGHGLALPRSFRLQDMLGSNGVTSVVSGLTSAWEVLAFMLLVFFFTLLMLIEASAWRRKTAVALPGRQTAAVIETVQAVAHKVRRFLLIRTVLGAIAAVAVTAWLWLTGVDFAPFWGVLFFLLNYLPNVGSIIAGIPPTLLAFVQFGPGWALLVAGGLLAMEQVSGNFLDPHLQGRTLNVSSLVVLLSVILWGWIWGVPGALIAVPLTVTMILICAKFAMLRPIAVLLSGDEHLNEADQLRD